MEDTTITTPASKGVDGGTTTTTIAQLLARRQYPAGRNNETRVDTRQLAFAGAWNRRRMENMILAVGRTTPAAGCLRRVSLSRCTGGDGRDSDESSDASMSSESNMSMLDDADDDDDDDDDDPSSSENDGDDHAHMYGRGRRRRWQAEILRSLRAADERQQIPRPQRRRLSTNAHGQIMMTAAMHHQGCINTASWMECPWRLVPSSRPQQSSSLQVAVDDDHAGVTTTTSQIITSGDDRVLKIWDVNNAMGSCSPRPGGWDTYVPFSSRTLPNDDVMQQWQREYNDVNAATTMMVPGSITLVHAMASGHRANVFEVAPVPSRPGQVLSTGADGVLRLTNLERGTSALVVTPYDDNNEQQNIRFLFEPPMAFTFRMLSPDTGVLCSETGLTRFDLRVSAREQSSRTSLIARMVEREHWGNATCKACVPWRSLQHGGGGGGGSRNSSSPCDYVFVGGANEDAVLLDLRQPDQVVERYRPRTLDDRKGNVSVSGLDVSKDGRELLVSYECDQIYTFDVCGGGSSSSMCGPVHPSPNDLMQQAALFEDLERRVPESSRFVGHFNRLTFLKASRYAGPNDEYICTGSDSGHAYIYDKASGTVAALLAADSTTCNGIIPHPDLPLFVTYGIEHTAKLWRATPPVDVHADDSNVGRYATFVTHPMMERAPLTCFWLDTQKKLLTLRDAMDLLPDMVPLELVNEGVGRVGIAGHDTVMWGNALSTLPLVLRDNVYEYQTHDQDNGNRREMRLFFDDQVTQPPVNLRLQDYMSDAAKLRRTHQARTLGLRASSSMPWKLSRPDSGGKGTDSVNAHDSDLLLQFPSDWLLCDDTMAAAHDVTDQAEAALEVNDTRQSPSGRLYEAAALCKEGGTAALKEGHLSLATRRYDKAIRYCAIALMDSGAGRERYLHLSKHLISHLRKQGKNHETRLPTQWSAMLELLVACELNVALVHLKQVQYEDALRCSAQASRFCHAFVQEKGKAVFEIDGAQIVESAPDDVYEKALGLAVKAYYRSAWASMELELYDQASLTFQLGLISLERLGQKPDATFRQKYEEVRKIVHNRSHKRRNKYARLRHEFGRHDEDRDGNSAGGDEAIRVSGGAAIVD